jgi:hypothetical protein
MSVPVTTITFYPLRRFDSPQYLLGAGFLAGLLVFCVWLWQRPDGDRQSVRARGNSDIASAMQPSEAGGVLSGITGASGRGASFITSNEEQGSAFFEEEAPGESDYDAEASVEEAYAAGDADADADSMAIGDPVGAPPMEEGAALTDSLLGAPPEAAGAGEDAPNATAQGAPLQAYFVEIEVAPGQVEQLQLNAESPEHARAILREFRGDPRILRGPSTEPLQ